MNNTEQQKENARVVLDMLGDIYPDRLELSSVYIEQRPCGTLACIAGHLADRKLLDYQRKKFNGSWRVAKNRQYVEDWYKQGLYDFGNAEALIPNAPMDGPLYEFARRNGFEVDDMDCALYRFGRLSGMTDAECFALAKEEMVKA